MQNLLLTLWKKVFDTYIPKQNLFSHLKYYPKCQRKLKRKPKNLHLRVLFGCFLAKALITFFSLSPNKYLCKLIRKFFLSTKITYINLDHSTEHKYITMTKFMILHKDLWYYLKKTFCRIQSWKSGTSSIFCLEYQWTYFVPLNELSSVIMTHTKCVKSWKLTWAPTNWRSAKLTGSTSMSVLMAVWSKGQAFRWSLFKQVLQTVCEQPKLMGLCTFSSNSL